MSKTILVCGFGAGISNAVAEKFGAEGFSVGLVARNRERLAEGAPVQPKVIDRSRVAHPEVDAAGATGKDSAS